MDCAAATLVVKSPHSRSDRKMRRAAGLVAAICASALAFLPAPSRAQEEAESESQPVPAESPRPAAQTSTADSAHKSSRLMLGIGYSFGHASFNSPFPDDNLFAALSDESGNEPMVSLSAESGRGSWLWTDLKLGLSSFGRVMSVEDSTGGASENPSGGAEAMLPDVRRSIIADLTLRTAGFPLAGEGLTAHFGLNTGFIFDAQDDEEMTEVEDASGYFFVGPSFVAKFDQDTEVLVDIFAGQSEVMTNLEIFSRGWDDNRTFRMKPRIRAFLGPEEDKNDDEDGFSLTPLIIGLWTDVGFDDETGDTFVIFFTKPVLNR